MKRGFFIVLGLVFIGMPFAAFAAISNPASLLGGGSGLVPQCEGAFCRACDLVELGSNVINFGVAFSVIVATLMFAYAGILYVTAGGAGPEQLKKAHQVLVNIFVGLLAVLLAWLLVNILFSVLTGKELNLWTKISCVANPITAAFPAAPNLGAGTPVTGGSTSVGTPVSSPGGTLTNAEAIRRLEAAGVCGGTTGRPCLSSASINGVQAATIDQAIILHNACGCTFTVTSGTDGSHATHGGYTHGAGYKLDIRYSDNPKLEAFVRDLTFWRHFDDWDGSGPGTYPADVYVDGCGNRYALEPNILDLQVRGAACSY